VCWWCRQGKSPNYKDVLSVKRFVSDRGKIIPRNWTGTCAKHQRSLTAEIKKARIMALLPFTEKHAL